MVVEVGGIIGLMLIQEGRGSSVVEICWKCDLLLLFLDLICYCWIFSKNKRGIIEIFDVSWNGMMVVVYLVFQVGE